MARVLPVCSLHVHYQRAVLSCYLSTSTTANHDHTSPTQPQAARATNSHQGPANAVAPTPTTAATAATATTTPRQGDVDYHNARATVDSKAATRTNQGGGVDGNSNDNSKTDDDDDQDGDDNDQDCYVPAGTFGPKAVEWGVQPNQYLIYRESWFAGNRASAVNVQSLLASRSGYRVMVECPGRYWNLREAQGIGYDVTARLQATGHVIGSRRGESQSRVTVTGHVRATGYRKACTSQYKSQSGFTDRARKSRASPKVSPNPSQRNGTRDRDKDGDDNDQDGDGDGYDHDYDYVTR
ncbi:hypothetical protein EDB85DRAFT_2281136 [Lactarius pseudohatsudake]|nr:hypothetical protein EDB85DRAFT_2281136 [Lactarius pseudohatsudake]